MRQLRRWFCAGLTGTSFWVLSVLAAGPALAAGPDAGKPVGWMVSVMLALVVAVATLVLLNRRYRDKLAPRNRAEDPVIASREDFLRALIRRDPQILEPLEEGTYGDPPAELATLAEALRYPAGALTVRLASGATIPLSSASESDQRPWRPGEKYRLADEVPEVEAEVEDLCLSCRAGRFVLHFGDRQAGARLRLANPAFNFQLRPESGQSVLLCPGDKLLGAADRVFARFDPEPSR